MKKYRFIWIPLLLLVYGLTMAYKFGSDLVAAGRAWQLWTFIAIDIIVCLFLSIFIKKRQSF